MAGLFGMLSLRAPGLGFIMITLALGQIVWGVAYRANNLTGGDNGINLRARPKFGIDLANETLDNLVMLYAIQTQREFETESRLTFVPDL